MRTGLLAGLGLLALASCSAPPTPSHSPSPSPVVEARDATAVLRLSGREIELSGGTCMWQERTGVLGVGFPPSADGTSFGLAAPLRWAGLDVAPDALPTKGDLEVTLAGQPITIFPPSLQGEFARDAASGTFSAETMDGAPVTGEFACPTVIDAD